MNTFGEKVILFPLPLSLIIDADEHRASMFSAISFDRDIASSFVIVELSKLLYKVSSIF